jgi:hypothetical protein
VINPPLLVFGTFAPQLVLHHLTRRGWAKPDAADRDDDARSNSDAAAARSRDRPGFVYAAAPGCRDHRGSGRSAPPRAPGDAEHLLIVAP